MADLNKVILMGHMTADPELKQTQSGLSVCSFSIGINRRTKGDQGQQTVDFLNIVAWRQQAEFVCRYFKKGSAIAICGQLQSRSYTDNQGNKRTAYETVADEVSFVGSKESGDSKNNEPTQPYVPTPYSTGNSQNFETISDDAGLPF